jgi:hypothetical protein
MQISEERIQEFKSIYKKEYGKELSDEDAFEAAHNLVGFAELCFKAYKKDCENKAKLKEKPKGFYLSELSGETCSCLICHQHISGESGWYDKYGPKCLLCQKAINKKIIPASVAKNSDSWYSLYDLENRFNINRAVMRMFVKEGILKPRIVPTPAGKPHVYLFLIKDNIDTLPPKKLTEPQMVKEVKEDGREWYHLEPWYMFVDPFEALKGYKIMNYMRAVEKNNEDKK